MILENLSIFDITLLPAVLILFFVWFLKEIRNVCDKPEGFIKFTQITFILGSWGIFLLIFGYYLLFNPKETVSILSLFLTIVVGFLGTIMGLFFSKEALEEIIKKYKSRGEIMLKDRNILLKTKMRLENIKKETEKLRR